MNHPWLDSDDISGLGMDQSSVHKKIASCFQRYAKFEVFVDVEQCRCIGISDDGVTDKLNVSNFFLNFGSSTKICVIRSVRRVLSSISLYLNADNTCSRWAVSFNVKLRMFTI